MSSRKLILFIILIFSAVLSGCAVGYGDSLMTAPRLPMEYDLLQQKLDEIRANGMVYAVAESGERQAVKLIDLNGDGEDEVVAFFRGTSGEFSMFVFRWHEDGYVLVDDVQIHSTSLRGVYYPVIDDEGNVAIALTWAPEDSATVSGLTVYGYNSTAIHQMLDTQFLHMDYMDVVGDSGSEFLIVSKDRNGNKTIGMYKRDMDHYSLVSSAPICIEASSIRNIKLDMADFGPALFIDSITENGNGYVSDVIRISSGQLENETIDVASQSGALTYREISVFCKDINGDGYVDIPSFVHPEEAMDMESQLRSSRINWYSFESGRLMDYVGTTFHSSTGEWYMNWPADWGNDVTVSRNSSMYMVRTEFSIGVDVSGEADESQALKTVIFNVIEFFGDNRFDYLSQYSNFTVIQATSQKIFCYSIPGDTPQQYALTDEQVRSYVVIEVD